MSQIRDHRISSCGVFAVYFREYAPQQIAPVAPLRTQLVASRLAKISSQIRSRHLIGDPATGISRLIAITIFAIVLGLTAVSAFAQTDSVALTEKELHI